MAGPSGHSAAGFAAAHANAEARRITEEQNQADLALRTNALALDARRVGNEESRLNVKDIHDRIDSTMKMIGSTIETSKASGASPEKIAAAIGLPLKQVTQLASGIGRDPSQYLALAEMMIGTPSAPQTDLGKLEADRRSGLIDDATYEAKVKALTTPAGTTVNVNNAGETAFAKSLGDEFAKDLVKGRQRALDAASSLQGAEQAKMLLDGGIITGAGADWMLSAGKVLQQAGINLAPDAIANTEAFAASQAKQVAEIIKQFGAGTGLSDADREFALQAAGGKITMTEQSIRRILDINARAARNTIRAYNAEAQRHTTGMPFDLRVPEPPEPEPPPVTKTIQGKTYIQQGGKWFEQ
jgi:hypothetical protein